MGFTRSLVVQCGLFLSLWQQALAQTTTCTAAGSKVLGAIDVTDPGVVTTDPDVREPADPAQCLPGCSANRVEEITVVFVELKTACTATTTTGTVKFTADVEIKANAKDSYDFGLHILGQDSCLVYGFQCTDAGAEFDAEAPSPSPGDGGGNNNNDAVDTCADLPKGSSIFTEVELEVPCQAGGGDLILPYCASWDNNRKDVCTSANNIKGGTSSQCDCQGTGEGEKPIVVKGQCLSFYSFDPVDGNSCNSDGTTTVVINSSNFVDYDFEIRVEDSDDPVFQGSVDKAAFPVNLSGLTRGVNYQLFVVGCGSTGSVFEAPCVPVDSNPTTCTTDDDCDGEPVNKFCCGKQGVCVNEEADSDLTACGDPHMTGFLGQKFDFTGEDSGWYCLIKDDNMQVSMRVTTPVPSLPEITYITGLSVLTTDVDGSEHDIAIQVKDPYNLESSCQEGVAPCLADGSLNVVLDGEEALLAPGTVSLGSAVAVSAVNLPGACRSFGFDKYWERKVLENAAVGRRLRETLSMSEWILEDPTATNMEECAEYVGRAETTARGVFAHQSEHASFQISTPKATIRLSHGRLHQVAMRDPTDQYDLPEHLTWQMNFAVDHTEVSPTATGILGETFEPTLDSDGNPIMSGMEAIRGNQEDYRVKGPLEVDFVRDSRSL